MLRTVGDAENLLGVGNRQSASSLKRQESLQKKVKRSQNPARGVVPLQSNLNLLNLKNVDEHGKIYTERFTMSCSL